MCGIAGLTGEPNREAAGDQVRCMLAKLARRGPNSEGLEQWDQVSLGHRRLSIYDLSDAGLQPMVSEDRTLAVVFNGAIYNFLPLRAELESRGYRFRSRTDTEILLHGYREWGVEALIRRLRGMFAIGLWDERLHRLFLIRDRLGVKPLLYARKDGRLAFASTAAALEAGGFAGKIDDAAVAEYLEFGYVTENRVIYQGLRKLPAATAAEFTPDGTLIREWRYWEQPVAEPEGKGPSFEESIERTEELFLDAVRLRLEADVPVGALLSGGVDSGLVCWAIQKLGGQVKAFTISTPGDAGDETADARTTAAELGIRHEVIEMRADREPSVADLVEAYGEPFGCASALGMMQVSEAVKPQATVLLTGDGGDDVFLGYPEHKNLWLAQRMAGHLPAPLARGWLAARQVLPGPVWKQLGPLRRAAHFMDYCAGGVGAVAAAHDGLQNYNGMLGRKLAELSVDQRRIRWTPESGRQVLADFLHYDQQTRFPGEYLQKVDGGSMFHALEARSPFLDHEIWDFAGQLPFGRRLEGGRLKAILRELAARRISPRVAYGAKRGFSVPVRSWLTGRWKELAEDTFARPRLAEMGWVDLTELQGAWRRAVSAGQAPVQLWYLFVLEHWLRANHG